MAFDLSPQFIGTHCAGEDMSNATGKAVVFNTFERWQIAGSTGPLAGVASGILCGNVENGKTAKVQIAGVGKVRLGGDVLAGRRLGFDANGDIVEDPTGVVGWAMENGTAGNLASALLNFAPPGGGADGVVISGNTVGTDLVLQRSIGADVVIDLSNLPGGGVTSEQTCSAYTAGEAISALKLVYIDPVTEEVFLADHTNLPAACTVVGFTKTAVASGASVQVISEGRITDASLSFNTALDATLFLSTAGNVAQAPVTSGYLLQAGFVTGTDSMYVDIQPPIILA